MIDGGVGIQKSLYGDTAIKALLAEQSAGVPALFNARLIPSEFKGAPVINYYRLTPFDGGSEIDQYSWSINCRAVDEETALQLADLVFTNLKRSSTANGGYEYFFVPSILATIPPQGKEDDFNVPVDVIVKIRKV